MMKRIRIASFTLVTMLGCHGTNAPAPTGAASAPGHPAETPRRSSDAQQVLDGLDTRTAVPLLPMMANHQKQNMRDHLAAVREAVTAIASKDFDGVEKAARQMGYSEQMGTMCTHMGAGAPGFTEQALAFHHTADTIADAARQKDEQGVLTALGQTLSACTGCHATFKQRVVSDAEWTALTKAAPPGHPGQGT